MDHALVEFRNAAARENRVRRGFRRRYSAEAAASGAYDVRAVLVRLTDPAARWRKHATERFVVLRFNCDNAPVEDLF